MPYNEFKQKLKTLKSWQLIYREIMLFGKELPDMPEQLKTDDTLIKGCESNVWLNISVDDNNKLSLLGDSDTRIVKGLLGLIILMYQGNSIEKNINAFQEFEELGLIRHLSPSRGNGIKSIADTIELFIKQYR